MTINPAEPLSYDLNALVERFGIRHQDYKEGTYGEALLSQKEWDYALESVSQFLRDDSCWGPTMGRDSVIIARLVLLLARFGHVDVKG